MKTSSIMSIAVVLDDVEETVTVDGKEYVPLAAHILIDEKGSSIVWRTRDKDDQDKPPAFGHPKFAPTDAMIRAVAAELDINIERLKNANRR